MSNGRTIDLTFTFKVEKQNDDDYPWDVELQSVEPKNPENCGKCSDLECIPRDKLCDACNAEENMDCMGPDCWLEHTGIKIDKEGTIIVNAYIEWWYTNNESGVDWDDKIHFHVNWSRWERIMTDQPGDYYVAEAVGWIDSVEGLSDANRSEGREIFAVLLAHHDVHLHGGRVPFDECLRRARREFAPDNDRAQEPERRDQALRKLGALPAFDETILAAPMDDEQNRGEL